MRRSPTRLRLLALAGAALLGTLGAIGTGLIAPSAAALDYHERAVAPAPAYKYWGYYHGAGEAWEFSMVGAQEYVPEDGSVEGWRYGIAGNDGRLPRVTPDFASICGEATADAGHKLVAVVIDYGIQEEAEGDDETPPARGACADVPSDATGQETLESIADLTIGDAGIASVDGYPSVPTTETFSDASIPVDEPAVELVLPDSDEPASSDTTAGDDSDDDGPPWSLIGAGAVVVVVGGGAFVVARRRG